MHDTIFTLSKDILEATPGEKAFNPGQETLHTLWSKIVHNQGGSEIPAPQDTIAILWKKYLINLGGTPHAYDNAFNFLWKSAKQKGITLSGVETMFTLIKKLAQ